MDQDREHSTVDCTQPKICAIRFNSTDKVIEDIKEDHIQSLNELKKGQDEILKELLMIKSKLYVDNGAECMQTKINKNRSDLDSVKNTLKSVIAVGVFLAMTVSGLLVKAIWTHVFQ